MIWKGTEADPPGSCRPAAPSTGLLTKPPRAQQDAHTGKTTMLCHYADDYGTVPPLLMNVHTHGFLTTAWCLGQLKFVSRGPIVLIVSGVMEEPRKTRTTLS